MASGGATTQKVQVIYWNVQGAGGNPNGSNQTTQQTYTNSAGQTCIDIFDNTGTVKITTYCSNSNSGGKISAGPGGGLSAFRTNGNLTNFMFTFGCGIGIVNCNNTDNTSNGTGAFLLLLLIIFSYAILVAIHYQAQRLASHNNVQLTQVLSINPMLLVVMLVVDTFIALSLGWTSNIIFYSLVLVIAGFVTFGIYKHYKGGSE